MLHHVNRLLATEIGVVDFVVRGCLELVLASFATGAGSAVTALLLHFAPFCRCCVGILANVYCSLTLLLLPPLCF
jgi:hypothetical protein